MLLAIVHDLKKAEEYEYQDIRKKCKNGHLVLGAAFIREVNSEVGNVISDEELDDICYSILCHHGNSEITVQGIDDILLNQADILTARL